MADLNNGWTVEIRDGKEPNQEVEPALEGLGISYDTGVEGRDNTQDQPFTDKDGNGNQVSV